MRGARKPGSPARRCRDRPSRPGRRLRPSAARSRAKRQRFDLGAERELVAGLAGVRGTDQVEIEAVADQSSASAISAALASAVRHAGPPGPRPTTASRPCGRPIAVGHRSGTPRATAQVTRAPLRLGTNEAAARGRRRRGPHLPPRPSSRSRGTRPRKRVGQPSVSCANSRAAGRTGPARPARRQRVDCGLGGLEVERDDAGDASGAQPALGRARPGPERRSARPGDAAASAPTPERAAPADGKTRRDLVPGRAARWSRSRAAAPLCVQRQRCAAQPGARRRTPRTGGPAALEQPP